MCTLTVELMSHCAYSRVLVTGRIAAKRQTAGIKFTQRLKSAFSPRRGDLLVAPIQVKCGSWRGRGDSVWLGHAKFRANRCTWVKMIKRGPPKVENFHILVMSRSPGPMGEPFDRFLQLLEAFIRQSIAH